MKTGVINSQISFWCNQLVQPNRVRISGDEFVDGQTVDLWRTRHSFLLAIDEDRHVVLFPLTPRPLFGFGQLAFPF